MHSNGLPGIKEDATKEEQEREIHRIFQETFSTESGKICLNFILNDLMFYDVCHTESEQALANYAKVLINSRLGIIDTVELTDQMINSIRKQ